ncbi:hypothetical protein B0O99DRAFT_715386 [Bisporella sp. PMI_857]|nr:hypothetical protein B0O99DRAFT_715386 [Bisporella sp. PMI_857]
MYNLIVGQVTHINMKKPCPPNPILITNLVAGTQANTSESPSTEWLLPVPLVPTRPSPPHTTSSISTSSHEAYTPVNPARSRNQNSELLQSRHKTHRCLKLRFNITPHILKKDLITFLNIADFGYGITSLNVNLSNGGPPGQACTVWPANQAQNCRLVMSGLRTSWSNRRPNFPIPSVWSRKLMSVVRAEDDGVEGRATSCRAAARRPAISSAINRVSEPGYARHFAGRRKIYQLNFHCPGHSFRRTYFLQVPCTEAQQGNHTYRRVSRVIGGRITLVFSANASTRDSSSAVGREHSIRLSIVNATSGRRTNA